MVQILPLFLATLAAISPVVQAASCTPGLDYCGFTLTSNGEKPLLGPEITDQMLRAQILTFLIS